MKRLVGRYITAILLCIPSGQVSASDDLLSIYRDVIANNAELKAAKSERQVELQEEEIALSQLLPTVYLTGSDNFNRTDRTSPSFFGNRTDNFKYQSYSYSLNLRQPLMRPALMAGLDMARAQGRAAEAKFRKKEQELILKVVTAYCDALYALDQQRAVEGKKEALERQLMAEKRAFDVGTGTLTDIDEVQSRLDMASAEELEATNRIAETRETLESLIGRPIVGLKPVLPSAILNAELGGGDLEQWVGLAEQYSPELEALRQQIEMAVQEVNKARAGHAPTVDLVAMTGQSANDSMVTLNKAGDMRYQIRSIGVQVNVPLLSGGYHNAMMAQALAKQEQYQYLYEEARRKLLSDVRKAYNAVTQGKARINAASQARNSAEKLVYSTDKSVQAGIRSQVDASIARQQLMTIERDFSESAYKLLMSKVKLLSLVGMLGQNEVLLLNQWTEY